MTTTSLEERIIPRLVQDTRDISPDVRELALDRLGTLPDQIDVLVTSLGDPDPEVRATAAANLGRVRCAGAWPALVRSARSERTDRALCEMIGALAGYAGPVIRDLLLDVLALDDRQYQVRKEAVVQLWKYEPEVVIPRLVEVALGTDHELVRFAAVDSLEILEEVLPADPARHDMWRRLADDGYLAVVTVAANVLRRQSASPAIDILAAVTRRLQHPSPAERSFALYRLGLLAPHSAKRLAAPLLDDEQPGVRAASCACLGAIRDDEGIPLLLATLRSDPEPSVITSALLGLENYYSDEIGEVLLDVLEARLLTGDGLSILCRQLWKYPSNRTTELLRELLRSSAKLAQRSTIESALALIERLDEA